MPGSAMPPWSHLGEEKLQALVMAVKHLALEGKARSLAEGGDETGTMAVPESLAFHVTALTPQANHLDQTL